MIFSNNQILSELLVMYPFLASLPSEDGSKLQYELNTYNMFLNTIDETINRTEEEYNYYHILRTKFNSYVKASGIEVQ